MGNLENATTFISSLSEKIQNDAKLRKIKTAIELAQNAPSDNNIIKDLQSKIDNDPNDHQSRIELSLYYNSNGNQSEAADLLIESIKLDREWNEKAAQNQLLKFFEVWGFTDPVAIAKRKNLSSILFS
jgi:putative thioredoxin